MIKLSSVVFIATALVGCKAKVTKVDDKAVDKVVDKVVDKAVGDKADEPKHAAGGGAEAAEAQLALNNLGKHAKQFFVENAGFPKGKVGPTPATPCCPQACPQAPEAWSDPVWKQLDFVIAEPTHFQYSYDSDGTAFTATAVGGEDCAMTITLTGSNEAGNPKVTLTGP
jgi:hypothetical protein